MQPASENCSYLEELSCKEYSLKENQFCFNQNQDNQLMHFFQTSGAEGRWSLCQH